MTKKFTEENFNKLVMLQEKEYPNNVYSSSRSSYNNIDEALEKYDSELYRFVEDNDLENQVVALMNLETRQWAHDKFVEKEKKFYWTSKKRSVNDVNKKTRIYREEFSGALLTYTRVTHDHQNINEEEQLTESEIREWGYNPDMFNKEEV